MVFCFNPRTPYGVRRNENGVCGSVFRFQSTHSLRSATSLCVHLLHFKTVSIHALLTECDEPLTFYGYDSNGFNPRTPYGVRPDKITDAITPKQFQSTHSLRSATPFQSFHALSQKFQSTHSLRSATQRWRGILPGCSVSIHALLTECDKKNPSQKYH